MHLCVWCVRMKIAFGYGHAHVCVCALAYFCPDSELCLMFGKKAEPAAAVCVCMLCACTCRSVCIRYCVYLSACVFVLAYLSQHSEIYLMLGEKVSVHLCVCVLSLIHI